jgi:uncharacterized protein YjbJ (UPF0337 family)
MSFKEKAEEIIKKAEARSEKIDGKVKENMGNYSNDPDETAEGQEKQAKAEAKRQASEDMNS